jgi:hypothetical protein
MLGLPTDEAISIILFAHGSGSGRFSPRNTFVAAAPRDVIDLRTKRLPGATRLFEEPGTLETVVALARSRFLDHLGAPC